MRVAIRSALLTSVSLSLFAGPAAWAQDQDADAGAPVGGFLEEIVVTAVPSSGTQIETSASVSSLSLDQLELAAPRSTAEIFRNIPGIRSESSGGPGGNANIAVRGLPISTGGAKFLSLQEDGLPILQYGDIAFATQDIFLRADRTLARVEAIRGGSASTFATNSPGGVINFISKTGRDEGGSIEATRGIGFDETRVDFEYGGPVTDDWLFHVGGFYRTGEGPREAGYTANDGGQVKANITREFDNGHARLYVKHLNDHAITYLPMPIAVSGTNDNPDYSDVPGFDRLEDTPHTPFLLTNFGIGGDGNLRTKDVSDGVRALSTAVGGEFVFDLDEVWTISDKFRYADNSGGFVSPFPAGVIGDGATVAAAVANAEAGTAAGANPVGARLVFANGPNAGQAFPGNNPSGLAMTVALFDVDLNKFDNFANDLFVKRSFNLDDNGFLDVTLGYYKAIQNIDMDWVWNSYVLEVKGEDAALLDVIDGDGTLLTDNGLFDYGDPFGSCCHRSFDTKYDTDAPYASVFWERGRVNVDLSARWTHVKASGNFAGTINSVFDVNRDGTISVPEQSVSFIDNANQNPLDYNIDYWSYSFGSNFLINPDLAVFARYSRGASSNADRLLFGPAIAADGSLTDEQAAIDFVKQFEGGVKYRRGALNLFATFFYAETEEQNFEVTSLTFVNRDYEALGIEVEGAYSFGPIDLSGGVTWTDAEVAQDAISPELEGNTPRRQADFIYQATAQYNDHGIRAGANVIGTTSAFTQFNNELKMPGYAQVNLFGIYEIADGLLVSVNANNVFDTFGLTEAEEGTIPANGIIRGRSINGRTVSVSLSYSF